MQFFGKQLVFLLPCQPPKVFKNLGGLIPTNIDCDILKCTHLGCQLKLYV